MCKQVSLFSLSKLGTLYLGVYQIQTNTIDLGKDTED